MRRKLLAGITTVVLVAGGSAIAVAATGAAPKHTTINAVTSTVVKINRYIQDGTRWQNDVYKVRSGGTITIVNLAASDGPHTFSVVRKSDLPRTVDQINNCSDLQHDWPRAWCQPAVAGAARVLFRRTRERQSYAAEHRRAGQLGLHRAGPACQGDPDGHREAGHDALFHVRDPSLDAGEDHRRPLTEVTRPAGAEGPACAGPFALPAADGEDRDAACSGGWDMTHP